MTTRTGDAEPVELFEIEREILRPAESCTVSEWCDRHRVLTAESGAAFPGPWRTDTNPVLRGILDAYGDPRCTDLVIMGSTQWGKTETVINCALHTMATAPVPIVWVMATEPDANSFCERRLKTAIEACDELRRHKTTKKKHWRDDEIALRNGAWVRFAWPGSPSRLSMWAAGRVFMDEADKYPPFSGREADPVSLVGERTRWFADAKTITTSTPTTEAGYIHRAYQQSDRRTFWVPCIHCGAFQSLTFSRETVRWPEGTTPERLKRERLAVYVCKHCEREIKDTDKNKRGMIARGVWVPEGGRLEDGRVVGVPLDAEVRGFHVNALYSPVLSWSDTAAKFLKSKDEVGTLVNFTNSWLGLPWIERLASLTTDRLAARAIPTLPAGTVPRDAVVLTAGADVQEHEIYYAVRAHLGSDRSVTIYSGRIDSLEVLCDILIRGSWPVDGSTERRKVRLACIDSGYRTDQVYALCANFPDVLRPTKGEQRWTAPFTPAKIERDWLGKAFGLLLWHVDTFYVKTKLARKMTATLGAVGSWLVHASPSDEFLRHLSSEHRILVRAKKSGKAVESWEKKPGGGPNHWWDAEVLAEVAADMLGLYAMPAELAATMAAADEQARQAPAEATRPAEPARGDESGRQRWLPRREEGGRFGRRGEGGGWLQRRRER